MHQVLLIAARGLAHGKQRLSGVLDAPARSALNRRWLTHVLAVARSQCTDTLRVAVVSPDPDTLAFAEAAGAIPIAEMQLAGLNQALTWARAQLQLRGARYLTVLPADLPYLEPADVRALLDGPHHQVVIAPDLADRGTNGLGIPIGPDSLHGRQFPFAFGPDSCTAHHRAALAVGLQVRVVNRRGLQCDIDTPQDLDDWQRSVAAIAPTLKAEAES